MKIRNILLISTTAILLTGCFATTSANLEKQNFMNKFKIEKDYKSAAKYTYEMFQICRTNNLLTYKNDIYENVGKAEVTANGKITIFGGTNYWTKINFQKDDSGNTVTKDFGIPQGSPISAVLANIYMLDFDYEINKYLESIGGIYRRYSDDMVAICPLDKKDEVIKLLKV